MHYATLPVSCFRVDPRKKPPPGPQPLLPAPAVAVPGVAESKILSRRDPRRRALELTAAVQPPLPAAVELEPLMTLSVQPSPALTMPAAGVLEPQQPAPLVAAAAVR